MEECKEHCWHSTGQMLLSNPPQIEFICCRCGAKSSVRCAPGIEINPQDHGQFLPTQSILKFTN